MPIAIALIHEENGVFGISFPDFPGIASTGRDVDEAKRKGAEALAFHVSTMIEDGDPLPFLRTLEDLRADPCFRAAAEGASVAEILL